MNATARGTLVGSGFTADTYKSATRPELLFKIYKTAEEHVSPAATAYINSPGFHEAINKPLLSCIHHGKIVQVQRRARGTDLHGFVVQKRRSGVGLRPADQRYILAQLAGALLHLSESGFKIFDVHPLNVIIDPSTLQLEVVDLDSLQLVSAPCVCCLPARCSGRIGCIFHNAPEALASCKEERCDGRTMIYALGQFAAFLTIPEAPAESIATSVSPSTNAELVYIRESALPPRGSGWVSQLARRLLADTPEARPSLHQVVRYLDRQHALLAPPAAASPANGGAPPLPYAPWGYHVDSRASSTWTRMLVRWGMVSSAIRRDGSAQQAAYAVDWGSNEGFFSISLLHAFPSWHVLAVDVNDLYHGHYSQDVHRQKLAALLPTTLAAQSSLCQGRLSIDAVFKLRATQAMLDYQLALSIFHWLPLATLSEFNRVLGRFLRNAKTTFIELPDPAHDASYNGNPSYATWRPWYTTDVSVEQRIRTALEQTDTLFTVELLGTATIDYGPASPATTTRSIFRVDVFPAGRVAQHTKHSFEEMHRAIPCAPSAKNSGDSAQQLRRARPSGSTGG